VRALVVAWIVAWLVALAIGGRVSDRAARWVLLALLAAGAIWFAWALSESALLVG
jgi:hypothetical protein